MEVIISPHQGLAYIHSFWKFLGIIVGLNATIVEFLNALAHAFALISSNHSLLPKKWLTSIACGTHTLNVSLAFENRCNKLAAVEKLACIQSWKICDFSTVLEYEVLFTATMLQLGLHKMSKAFDSVWLSPRFWLHWSQNLRYQSKNWNQIPK